MACGPPAGPRMTRPFRQLDHRGRQAPVPSDGPASPFRRAAYPAEQGRPLRTQCRMTLEQIAGTLSYHSVLQRVSILPTLSLAHSAYIIVKCIRQALFGLGYDLGLRGAGPKAPDPRPHVSSRASRASAPDGSVRSCGIMEASRRSLWQSPPASRRSKALPPRPHGRSPRCFAPRQISRAPSPLRHTAS